MPIENFFAYTILRAALFSAASPAERLRSAGSLAIKVDDVNNSDGKASLKRQKSPENTTDTQGMSKFYWFYEKSVHISKYVSL